MKKTILLQLALAIGIITGCYEDTISESRRVTEEQTDLALIIYKSIFTNLYSRAAGETVKTSESFTAGIIGPEGGNATIVKSKIRNLENNFPHYDDNYVVSVTGYSEGGYLLNGSFSFYTGQRHESIYSPPTTDFIYTGGGSGGSLTVSGTAAGTVPISIDVLNMLNSVTYHFNETLVFTQKIEGRNSSHEMPMLAGLYRQTFREALLALIHSESRESVITVEGPRGGAAVLSIKKSVSGSYTTQTDTFSFKNYRDNDLVLNGTLSRKFKYNTRSGDIVSGCSNEQYMKVTGLYETSVKHVLTVEKPGSIWNFRMGYFVDRFYCETVSVRLGVGVGF